MDLKAKAVVITGAAQGLGQKMAEVLAAEGAKLALVDLDEAKLEETMRRCRGRNGIMEMIFSRTGASRILRHAYGGQHQVGKCWRC
jgi:short-subunit dehydrogenase